MDIKILVEDCVGEIRAAAYTSSGLPVSLFLNRHISLSQKARWGGVYAARLSKRAPEQGGGFAELESGETVFLRSAAIKDRTEGERFEVLIDAEQRRGKVSRGRLTQKPAHEEDVFEAWLSTLPGSEEQSIEHVRPGDERVAAAFDEALSESVILEGGGVLRIAETPALIAVDIDTAGRRDAGRAYERAQKINEIAAETLARQLSLRGLGGAVVLDCVSPLRKDAGGLIKQAFLKAFRSLSTRKAEALAPSPFGLMEAAIAWRFTPIAHIVLDEAGSLSLQSELLASLRTLEQELARGGAGTYALHLPQKFVGDWVAEKATIERGLAGRYGARFSIDLTPRNTAEVHKV